MRNSRTVVSRDRNLTGDKGMIFTETLHSKNVREKHELIESRLKSQKSSIKMSKNLSPISRKTNLQDDDTRKYHFTRQETLKKLDSLLNGNSQKKHKPFA